MLVVSKPDVMAPGCKAQRNIWYWSGLRCESSKATDSAIHGGCADKLQSFPILHHEVLGVLSTTSDVAIATQGQGVLDHLA